MTHRQALLIVRARRRLLESALVRHADDADTLRLLTTRLDNAVNDLRRFNLAAQLGQARSEGEASDEVSQV